MRPSLVTPTLNACLFPSSVTVSSMMLGFPSTLFTTACSNPEDFVNTSTDFSDAAASRFASVRPAPVNVAARRNSLRLENVFIPSLSVMSFRVLATRKTGKHAVRRPAQLFHSHCRRVIRPRDPALQVFEVLVDPGRIFSRAFCILFCRICRPIRQQLVFLSLIHGCEALCESLLRLC